MTKALEERIDQVDIILDDAIIEVDRITEERLTQFDEIAEQRIGNADIVATKASLSFEAAITRVIGIASVMAFITFLLWRMIVISRDNWEQITSVTGINNQAKKALNLIGPRLALQGFIGLIGVAIIYFAFEYFPGSQESRIEEVAIGHEIAYEKSLAAFDFRRARFHASQLQILKPDGEEGVRYRGLALKADLTRDVLTLPGLLQSPGRFSRSGTTYK